ncbi:hypothetical protein [Rhizobium freirei]|nr:hypothetical protein [Rhizobium freirei]
MPPPLGEAKDQIEQRGNRPDEVVVGSSGHNKLADAEHAEASS